MISESLSNYMKKTAFGKPNGICPLDANGLVPLANIDPNFLEYKGVWDALINSPLLTNGMPAVNIGNVYIVAVAGTQFGIDFMVSDFVLYDGTSWKKVDGLSAGAFLKIGSNLSDLGNTTTARTNLGVYSTTQTDTLLNGKVSSISNTDTKITINNTTPTAPILNLQNYFRWGNGSHRGLIYQFNGNNTNNSSQIAFNASLITSINNLEIGFNAFNAGSDSDMISSLKSVLHYFKDNLPMKIRLVDVLNDTSFFTLNITSYAGESANGYLFNCVPMVGAETTMTNIVANGNLLYLLFDYTNKTYIDAQDLNLQNQITTNSTASVPVSRITGVLPIANGGNGSDLNNARVNLAFARNVYKTCQLRIMRYAGNFAVAPNWENVGSANQNLGLGHSGTASFDNLVVIKLPYPVNLTSQFYPELLGTGYKNKWYQAFYFSSTADLNNLIVGMASDNYIQRPQDFAINATSLSVGTIDQVKGSFKFGVRFNGTTAERFFGDGESGTSTGVTRYGFTTNSTGQGLSMIILTQETPTTLGLHWYNVYGDTLNYISHCIIPMPYANQYQSDIPYNNYNPCFTTNSQVITLPCERYMTATVPIINNAGTGIFNYASYYSLVY